MTEKCEVREKIISAKVKLMTMNPFYTKILMNYPIVEDNRTKTAYCAGNMMGYNKHFMAQLSLEETVFLIGHEMYHFILNHCDPKKRDIGNRDNGELANIAMDYVINQILVDSNIGELPGEHFAMSPDGKPMGKPFGPLYEDCGIYRGKTWEQVYDSLLNENKNNKDKRTIDDHNFNPSKGGGGDGEEVDLDQLSDELKEAIKQATAQMTPSQQEGVEGLLKAVDNKNKSNCNDNEDPDGGEIPMGGREPGNISGFRDYINAKEVFDDKVNWHTILRDYTTNTRVNVRSYARPCKKSGRNIILASRNMVPQKHFLKFAIAIDISASIDVEKAQRFLGRVHNIIDTIEQYELDIMCFNNEVVDHKRYTHKDKFDYKVMSPCGGTTTKEVFEFLRNKNITPDLCMIFTDAGDYEWGDPSGCKETLWCVDPDTDPHLVWSHNPKPKWGKFVYL